MIVAFHLATYDFLLVFYIDLSAKWNRC